MQGAIAFIVSMPSMSGWALRPMIGLVFMAIVMSFYALDVGLGFATPTGVMGDGECDCCFYALDVGLGFATDAL